MADNARRGVMVLTAMTPVLTAAAGVAINLATDGQHSWWAWVLVGVVTAVTMMLVRRQGASERSSKGSVVPKQPEWATIVDVRAPRTSAQEPLIRLNPGQRTVDVYDRQMAVEIIKEMWSVNDRP